MGEALHTKVVVGTYADGDTEETDGSIAKAIYDILATATTIHSVSTAAILTAGPHQMVAILVYTITP